MTSYDGTDGTVRPQPDQSARDASATVDPRVAKRGGGDALRDSRPVRSHAQLSRSQVLDATERCLIAKGYDGTTIRRIATALGCAVGSIYRYFPDKRQLLDAVTQRRFRPVLEQVRARQKPHRTMTLYARVAQEQLPLYRLMFWLAGIDETGEGAAGDRAAMPIIVRQIIEGWAAQLGSEAAAEEMWCLLHGRITLGGDVTPLVARLTDARGTTAVGLSPASQAPSPLPVSAMVAGDDPTLL